MAPFHAPAGDDPPVSRVRIFTLGALAVRDAADRDVSLIAARPKELALLVYVAVAGRPGSVRRDSLLALFWPDLDEAHARGALSQILYRIRGALGEDVLVSIGRDGVRLGDGCWCDATAFLDRIESDPIDALSLYSGEFLPGFHLTGSPAYGEWCEAERERLARLAGAAAERLAAAAEGDGDLAGAAAWLRRALQVSPTDERALRRLMDVLDRSGDRAGAVCAYDEFAGRLARFYDLEPAPETVAALESVRTRRDPRPVNEAAAPPGTGSEAGNVGAAPAAEPARPRRFRSSVALAIVATLGLWMTGSVPSLPSSQHAASRLLVTDVDPGGASAELGLAVREALVTDLGQSKRIEVVERGHLADVLARMRRPDTTAIDERVALEIARREGYPAVLSASVDRIGSGYQLRARLIEAASGEPVAAIRETAKAEDELIGAVERLARRLRRGVGESIRDVRASAPLPLLTTPSLEALTLLARARSHPDGREAIRLAEQAVLIDTAFAAAYYTLAPKYGDVGDPTRGDEYAELAYRYAHRLTTIERLFVTGRYHDQHGWADSAAWYRKMIVDRDPSNSAASIGVGNDLTAMNRFDEALTYYRHALDHAPNSLNAHNKVIFTLEALGRGHEADSVFGLMRSRFPHAVATNRAVERAIDRRDFTGADSLISVMLRDTSAGARVWGRAFTAIVASMRGRLSDAILTADAAADAPDTQRAFGPQAGAAYLRSIAGAALAAGAPARALPAVERLESGLAATAGSLGGVRALAVPAAAYARADRADDANRLLTLMDSVIAAKRLRTGAADEVRGILALRDGRYMSAVEHLERAKVSQYGVLTPHGQLAIGEAYEARAMWRAAAESYRALLDDVLYGYRTFYLGALRPVAHERLGRVHEMLGDTALALEHLRAFVELWRDADPEVSKRVAAARAAAMRLHSGGHTASGR